MLNNLSNFSHSHFYRKCVNYISTESSATFWFFANMTPSQQLGDIEFLLAVFISDPNLAQTVSVWPGVTREIPVGSMMSDDCDLQSRTLPQYDLFVSKIARYRTVTRCSKHWQYFIAEYDCHLYRLRDGTRYSHLLAHETFVSKSKGMIEM